MVPGDEDDDQSMGTTGEIRRQEVKALEAAREAERQREQERLAEAARESERQRRDRDR
jgi:hypothetical protein